MAEDALLARVRAELGGELAENGEIGRGRRNSLGDTKPNDRQNDATYVVARLNRDRPDLGGRMTDAAVAYGSRSIKRRRRTADEMDAIRAAISSTLEASHPMTVRQVYYQLTTLGVIDKTEKEYKSTVVRLLGRMRRDGSIPYQWLSDSTRWMRKPQTYDSAAEAVERLAAAYRRNLWTDSDAVEVWIEKEALAGVLVEVTERWDVPLMVTRGYPSMSFLHSAAVQMTERWLAGGRTFIYYLGDLDPSGRDIDRAVVDGVGQAMRSVMADHLDEIADRLTADLGEDEAAAWYWPPMLGKLAASTDDKERERRANRWAFENLGGTFERLGVLPGQVSEWSLPSRPTKRSDTRSKNFTGESVELDAIPADTLRNLAETAIKRHTDQEKLAVLEVVEEEERRGLEDLARSLRAA